MKPHVMQRNETDLISDSILLIYFQKFLTLSNQTSCYNSKMRITLHQLVSSVNNLYKQFGPRPAQQNVGHDLDTNCLTLIIFLKNSSKWLILKIKYSANLNNS